MSVEFEWDHAKAIANERKHGVSFVEGATVFADPLAKIFVDDAHSGEEVREIIVGNSDRARLLLVCFTERTERIRIISARKATRQERIDYEENHLH